MWNKIQVSHAYISAVKLMVRRKFLYFMKKCSQLYCVYVDPLLWFKSLNNYYCSFPWMSVLTERSPLKRNQLLAEQNIIEVPSMTYYEHCTLPVQYNVFKPTINRMAKCLFLAVRSLDITSDCTCKQMSRFDKATWVYALLVLNRTNYAPLPIDPWKYHQFSWCQIPHCGTHTVLYILPLQIYQKIHIDRQKRLGNYIQL